MSLKCQLWWAEPVGIANAEQRDQAAEAFSTGWPHPPELRPLVNVAKTSLYVGWTHSALAEATTILWINFEVMFIDWL